MGARPCSVSAFLHVFGLGINSTTPGYIPAPKLDSTALALVIPGWPPGSAADLDSMPPGAIPCLGHLRVSRLWAPGPLSSATTSLSPTLLQGLVSKFTSWNEDNNDPYGWTGIKCNPSSITPALLQLLLALPLRWPPPVSTLLPGRPRLYSASASASRLGLSLARISLGLIIQPWSWGDEVPMRWLTVAWR